jgi:2-dehydropantoate 2-reductase
MNCAVNPVGALSRLRNGDLVRLADARRCMASAAEEGAAVAAAKGIRLAHRDMVRRVEAACRATAGNINSMLQDILRGRRTEVDALNGAIVRAGRAAGVPTPVNDALWRLVKALEEGRARRVAEGVLEH